MGADPVMEMSFPGAGAGVKEAADEFPGMHNIERAGLNNGDGPVDEETMFSP
jgi:hypothetical protein